eukprot:EG_transcript_10387
MPAVEPRLSAVSPPDPALPASPLSPPPRSGLRRMFASLASLAKCLRRPHHDPSLGEGRRREPRYGRRGWPDRRNPLRPGSQTSGSRPESPVDELSEQEMVRQILAPASDSVLLETHGTLQMQLCALTELNSRVETAVDRLFVDPVEPQPADQREVEANSLLLEVEERTETVLRLREGLLYIEAEMRRRGLQVVRPPEERGLMDVPDDPDLCHYCVTEPANAEYLCCRHDAACWTCVCLMRKANPHCPNCRARDPLVRVRPLPRPDLKGA